MLTPVSAPPFPSLLHLSMTDSAGSDVTEWEDRKQTTCGRRLCFSVAQENCEAHVGVSPLHAHAAACSQRLACTFCASRAFRHRARLWAVFLAAEPSKMPGRLLSLLPLVAYTVFNDCRSGGFHRLHRCLFWPVNLLSSHWTSLRPPWLECFSRSR